MSVQLLTEQCLELLSLKGGCTGSSEATLVKMPHCWKSRVTAHVICQPDLIYSPIKLHQDLPNGYQVMTHMRMCGSRNFRQGVQVQLR